MSTTSCPDCGKEVPVNVTVCPFCAYPFCLSETKPKTKTKPQDIGKKCPYCAMSVPKKASICPYCRKAIASTPAAKGCLVVIFVFLFFGFVASFFNDVKTPKQKTDFDAIVMSQFFVKQALKAPATAKFPPTRDVVAEQSGNRWKVTGYVDAQNSFGAMLRQYYSCELQSTGDKWTLINLEMP